MGKVAVFYLGGTIGMASGADGALEPQDWPRVRDDFRLLSRKAEIEADFFAPDWAVDSSHMTPFHWRKIAAALAEKYEDYAGFVVLQGTDTMAYTASALAFMFDNLGKPIVLTGAAKPLSQKDSNAADNFTLALTIASAGAGEAIPQVMIAFDKHILRGVRATKSSGKTVFETPNEYKPTGYKKGMLSFHWDGAKPDGDMHLYSDLKTRISVLTLIPGFDSAFYMQAFAQQKPDGIILQTFESGNAPDDHNFRKLIGGLARDNVPMLAVSQAFHGQVAFGKYAAGGLLRDHGVASGADMTLEAAVTKMMTQAAQFSGAELKARLETNLRGELTPQ